MLPPLQNEVAVVTGAGSGIGLALALACGAAGMKVAATDIDATRLNSARAQLTERGVVNVAIQHDVTDRASWSEAAQQVSQSLGTPLLLFNNAGVVASPESALEYDVGAWNWMLATNLTASLHGVQAFVPAMIARGRGGHIVNTGSSQSLAASAGYAGYTAAKFGLLGLSETLQIELAPHRIGVSVLCPGATRTGLFANSRSIAPDYVAAGGNPRAVLRHYLTPDEVAAKVMAAVHAGRFYIVTHPEYRSIVAARLRAIEAAFAGAALDDTAIADAASAGSSPLADLANIEEVEQDALRAYRAMSEDL